MRALVRCRGGLVVAGRDPVGGGQRLLRALQRETRPGRVDTGHEMACKYWVRGHGHGHGHEHGEVRKYYAVHRQ